MIDLAGGWDERMVRDPASPEWLVSFAFRGPNCCARNYTLFETVPADVSLPVSVSFFVPKSCPHRCLDLSAAVQRSEDKGLCGEEYMIKGDRLRCFNE